MLRSHPKAAWELVCLPKKEGGLGVRNLRTQNEALLLKHLHKFFNRKDIPLDYSDGSLPSSQKKGSFQWRDLLKLLDSFKGIAVVNVRDGKSCLLWEDMWLNHIPKLSFPKLFSFANNPQIALTDAFSAGGPSDLFHLAISDTALQQLITLAENLNSLEVTTEFDFWSYIWGTPLFFSLKLISIYLVIELFIRPLNGSRNRAAKTSIKCSFGYY